MSKIKSYNDLVAEKFRLENALFAQRAIIKDDVEDLKDHLQPVSTAISFVKKILSPDRHNPLLNVGVNVASNLILKKFVLAKSGWLTKLLVPFLVKNYSSHLIHDNKENIKESVSGLMRRSVTSTEINGRNTGSGNFLQRLGQKLKK